MKAIFKFLMPVSILFCHCSNPVEEYKRRPKVKFTRTHSWEYGEAKVSAQYFTYGKNDLVEKIETIDSISEHVGISDTKWHTFIRSQRFKYNGSNNISVIEHVNGNRITIEKFYYEDDELKYRTRDDGNPIDTTLYEYNADQVICTYKSNDLMYKNYLSEGVIDSTYISQGIYILGKTFYHYSDTADYSKVPLSMGTKLYDPGKSLVSFSRRQIGTVAEEKLKYEFDEKNRTVKITKNYCTDYSVTKVGYYE